MKQSVIVLVGAMIGGIIGHFGVFWMARQGFYTMVLPGGLIGLGAGFVTHRSRFLLPLVCGLLALANGIVTEWRAFPFKADDSFSFFVHHLGDLGHVTKLMIAAGAFIGFYVPFRRFSAEKTR